MIEYNVKVHDDGGKFWYLNGELHREDGPAIEFACGDKHWYLNGKRHRADGPAIECANNDKYWYFNGELHRNDGPAVERVKGKKYWYLNGVELSEADFNKTLKKPKTIILDGVTYTLERVDD